MSLIVPSYIDIYLLLYAFSQVGEAHTEPSEQHRVVVGVSVDLEQHAEKLAQQTKKFNAK